VLNSRRLQNMIRDVDDAIREHGEKFLIRKGHFNLIFEDIQNDSVAIVLFRAIEEYKNSISLEQIRTYLTALKYMRINVDDRLLEGHRYLRTSREEFEAIVITRPKRSITMKVNMYDFSAVSDSDLEDEQFGIHQKHFKEISAQASHIFKQVKWARMGEITLQMIVDWLFSLPNAFRNVDILEFVVRKMKVWTRKHKADDKVWESKFIDVMNTTEEFRNETRYLKQEDVPDIFDLSKNNTESGLQARELYKYIFNVLQMKAEELKFNSTKEMEDARASELVNHEFVPSAEEILNFCSILRHLNRTVVKKVLERAHDYDISELKFQNFLNPEVDVKSNVRSERAIKANAIFQHVQDEGRSRITLSQCREEVERIVAVVRRCGSFLRIQKTIKCRFERDYTSTQHELLGVEDFQNFMYHQVDGYRNAKYGRKKRTSEIKQGDIEFIPSEKLSGMIAQGVLSKEADLLDSGEN